MRKKRAKSPKIKTLSKPEETFKLHLRAEKINGFEREYKFHAERRWRIDFAWPDHKIAVEIEGGTYTQGRHVRPKGYEGDLEKYNAISEHGWALYRYNSAMVYDGRAIRHLKRVFPDTRTAK